MTRTVDAAFAQHLTQTATRIVRCYKLKTVYGAIIAATDHDRDLVRNVDADGPITYKASTAYESTAQAMSADLTADNQEIVGFLETAAISAADLLAGRFDGAELKVFFTVWDEDADGSPTPGILKLNRYTVGDVVKRGKLFNAQLMGMADRFKNPILSIYTPDCRHDLGDDGCKVQLEPPTWQEGLEIVLRLKRDERLPEGSPSAYNIIEPTTQNGLFAKATTTGTTGAGSPTAEPTWPTSIGGTVSEGSITWEMIRARRQVGTVATVTDNRNFSATGIDDPAGYGSPSGGWWGHIEWLTGANAGFIQEVKADDGAGGLELFQPAAFDIAAADTFKAFAACDKTNGGSGCKRFDNILNFGGFPHVPGTDKYLRRIDPATGS